MTMPLGGFGTGESGLSHSQNISKLSIFAVSDTSSVVKRMDQDFQTELGFMVRAIENGDEVPVPRYGTVKADSPAGQLAINEHLRQMQLQLDIVSKIEARLREFEQNLEKAI